jgi:hypothetical protein
MFPFCSLRASSSSDRAPVFTSAKPNGRYRVRTSDLLLVRDAQEGEGEARAGTPDADFGWKRDAFIEWLSAGGDVPWTG